VTVEGCGLRRGECGLWSRLHRGPARRRRANPALEQTLPIKAEALLAKAAQQPAFVEKTD